jgi:hypothetical protein
MFTESHGKRPACFANVASVQRRHGQVKKPICILVSDIKGGTQTEDVGEQGAEQNIWTRHCRKLQNEELHNLYSLPSIIRMIKSGHVA